MPEYITKAQAIDYIKSMEVLIGCTGVSVLTKGIEGLEGQQKWTSDKEGHPAACYGPVLGTDGSRVFVCKYNYALGIWINLHAGHAEAVKFWMPLPEPPKE